MDVKAESESDSVSKRESLQDVDKLSKKKAKKRKYREDTEDDFSEQKKYNQIKSEPESDIDKPKKKKKKHSESSLNASSSKEALEEIDNYLNIRVKQEQESFVDSTDTSSKKKNKHKKDSDLILNGLKAQHASQQIETEECGNKDNSEMDQIDDYLHFRVKQEQASFVEPSDVKLKKKKKSKKSLDTSVSDNYDLQSSESVNHKNDSELDMETYVKEEDGEYKKKKKKNKKKHQEEEQVNSEESESYNNKISKHVISTNKLVSSENNKSDVTQNTSDDMSVDEDIIDKDTSVESKHREENKIANISKGRKSKSSESSDNSDRAQTKQNKSISDRLKFEDDDTTDYSSVPNKVDENWPRQITNFVKFKKNITHATFNVQEDHFVSEDDDIWIVKCPHEFDIKDFLNVNLTLDNKCKIKLNGQTYEGVLDDSIQRVPILAYGDTKNKPVVKNMPVVGLTKFRKRIPKAHIPDQGMLPASQNTFIPLPETKCRHPLFGANYKKAIKIPSAVAERLNGHNASVQEPSLMDTCKPKKKKHKKEKCKVENDSHNETEAAPAAKKKRKRKHSDEVDGGGGKRVKRDSDSAEAWDSEQAIKNNLFGFE